MLETRKVPKTTTADIVIAVSLSRSLSLSLLRGSLNPFCNWLALNPKPSTCNQLAKSSRAADHRPPTPQALIALFRHKRFLEGERV